MSDIDWSKAGEGCIGAFTLGDAVFYVKTKCESDYNARPGFTGFDIEGAEYHVFTEYWKWHERPESWNGEGLPPVGMSCEVEGFIVGEWDLVDKILAHTSINGEDAAVFQRGDLIAYDFRGRFRPIRTAEQIAAEDREKAIHEMARIAAGYTGYGVSLANFSALFDAGYRKVEVKP